MSHFNRTTPKLSFVNAVHTSLVEAVHTQPLQSKRAIRGSGWAPSSPCHGWASGGGARCRGCSQLKQAGLFMTANVWAPPTPVTSVSGCGVHVARVEKW